MKNTLLLFTFLFFLSALKIKAQNYHKFLNNSSWCESENPLFGQPISYFVYNQSNDTIINNLTYSKILVSGGGTTFYIREDTITEKVYILDNNVPTEVVLYDFSLNVGDTLLAKHGWGTGNKLIVRNINIVSTLAGQRRSFYLSDSSGNFNYSTIESIGCPLDPFLNDYAVGDPVSALVCSYQNNVQIYNGGLGGYPCYSYNNLPCDASFTYTIGLNGQVTFTNNSPVYSSNWTSSIGTNVTVYNTPTVTINFPPCNGTYSVACTVSPTMSGTNTCTAYLQQLNITNNQGGLQPSYTYTVEGNGQIDFTNTSPPMDTNNYYYYWQITNIPYGFWSGTNSVSPTFTEPINETFAVSLCIYSYNHTGCVISNCITDTIFNSAYNTGIKNESSSDVLLIFPNPSNGNFILQNNNEWGLISVYNTLGELIYQKTVKENNTQIDISNQSNGTYLLRIGNNFTKIIKY